MEDRGLVFCGECKHRTKRRVYSSFGWSYDYFCAKTVKIKRDPVKRSEVDYRYDYCDNVNKNNDCKFFEYVYRPPKPFLQRFFEENFGG